MLELGIMSSHLKRSGLITWKDEDRELLAHLADVLDMKS